MHEPMDELHLVRTLLADPPPNPAAATRARARLDELIGSPAAVPASQPSQPSQPGQPGRTGRAGGRRRVAFGLQAAAAAVAVTVAVVVQTPGPADQGTGPGAPGSAAAGPPRQAAVLAAPELLLAAARQADRAAESTGRYWRIRTLAASTMTRVGTGAAAYALEHRSVSELWAAGRPGGRHWFGYRDLGAGPATPADAAKWRRAGSPTRWDLGPTDTVTGRHRILTADPGPGQVQPVEDAQPFQLGGAPLTPDELRRLPTDAPRLRRYLLGLRPDRDRSRPDSAPGSAAPADIVLFSLASQLLGNLPAPPAVRAAAFRLLAALPSVRSVGTVRDLVGRSGTGIALSQRHPSGVDDLRLVIDPGSGRLLGWSLTGGKNGSAAILAAGWTDARPVAPPAELPRAPR